MDTKKTRVVLLNTDLGYGGAEKNMVFVANSLARENNIQVTFLTYRDKNKDYQELKDEIKRVKLGSEDRGGNLISIIKSIREIRLYLMKNEVDVVISFLSPSHIRAVLASRGCRTKVILSERADPYMKRMAIKEKIVATINHLLFSMADGYVFQTEKAKAYYSKSVQNKSVVIPNFVNKLTRTSSRSLKEKKIVFVARAEIKQKRQDLIIDAFNMLSKEYPDYILELYGDGADLHTICDMARDNEKIKLCGVTTNIVESIQNAMMFVLTSDYEGIPNALLEAMSLGIPSISTDCSPGGAAMLIDNYKSGIIVERGNVFQIYSAMKYMIEHSDEAEIMGQNAMYVNEVFNGDAIGKKWVDFIKEI